jgi:hypothetical protein
MLIGLAVLAVGCRKPPGSATPDAAVLDAGKKVEVAPEDGGVVAGPDGGMFFPPGTAAEPCAADTYTMFDTTEDGGLLLASEDGGPSVEFGVCVALRKLNAATRLNDQPAAGPVDLRFEAGDFSSEIQHLPDAFGRLDVRAMKGRYDVLKYHPSGIFLTHRGYQEFGPIDFTKDQQRELGVRSHLMRGGVTFATLPFISQHFPPDVAFHAPGLPPDQTVSTSSIGGGYEVSFIEGSFALYLSSPPTALGGTELLDFPLSDGLSFTGPTMFDVNLKTHELEGSLRIDGKPIPDRRPGDDFQLEFTTSGGTDPTVRTHHDGAVADFHSLVPEGKYGVSLRLESSPDRHLPSMVYNKQISSSVDLSAGNQKLDVALSTFVVEGGILIDGVPVKPTNAYNYTMYWYGFSGSVEPWSLSYYEVPLDSSTFSLQVFPGNYYVMLFIDSNFAPNMVEGWFTVNKYLQVQNSTVMPVEIDTSLYQGRLLIDGQPPPAGQLAGVLTFRSREGGFYEKKLFCAEDGSFEVRVPKGGYEVNFFIDRKTFPEHASGQQRMISRLELDSNQVLDLHYDTVLVTGPMRVAGEVVPDSSALEETGMILHRTQDGRDFDWGFNGGRKNYRLRVPDGDYNLTYTIQKDTWDDVAWGSAPLGIKLGAHGFEATHSAK